MMKLSTFRRTGAALALAATAIATPAVAMNHGDARTVVDVAAGSANHKTLVTAVKSAGLVDTLSGSGPFTVFAPTDAAFAKLPAGTVDTLLQPANRDQLTNILTYHVVPGKVMAADVVKLINSSGGQATVKTVEGQTLTASLSGKNVILTDAKGGRATVTTTDLSAGNGVVHVIDSVVLPN